MPDYYLISHASVTKNYITAHRARELYAEEAQRASEVGLFGDLETGFYFWSIETENGLKLVHHSVTPVPVDEVPEDIRDRLDQTSPPGTPRHSLSPSPDVQMPTAPRRAPKKQSRP